MVQGQEIGGKGGFSYTAIVVLALLLTSSLVYVRRVPRLNKLLVGEGAPFRFLAILSGQFDYILSIFCLFLSFYILL